MGDLGGNKVTYSRWLYGRAMIELIREEGLSWTEISRIATGHGDSPGWAAQSYNYRSTMGEHHLRALEKYLIEKTSPDGNQVHDKRASPDQRKQMIELVNLLVDKHGWTNKKIADALGLSTPNQVSTLKKTGGVMVSRLTRMQAIVDRMEKDTGEKAEEPKSEEAGSPKSELSALTTFVTNLSEIAGAITRLVRGYDDLQSRIAKLEGDLYG